MLSKKEPLPAVLKAAQTALKELTQNKPLTVDPLEVIAQLTLHLKGLTGDQPVQEQGHR